MKKGKLLRKILILISLVALITSTVNTTVGFIVTATEPMTNTFIPDNVSISSFVLNKTVEHPLGEGYKLPDNICFEFKIELGSYYANSELTTSAGKMTADAEGSITVQLRPGADFSVRDIDEGTVVTVTEQQTSLEGFAIKGDATKQITVAADGIAAVDFVNTYTPAAVAPVNVAVGGVKQLEGRDWQEGDSFTFVLEQKKGESWEELGRKTVSYAADSDDFNRFSFDDVFASLSFETIGVYAFRISESKGALENVDYDETVNNFTVLVTDVDMDGKLEINGVAGTENTKVTANEGAYSVEVTFNNSFVPPVVIEPDPITVQVDVKKRVDCIGNVTHGADGFEFVLKNQETAERLAAVSDDGGDAQFLLSFTKADIGKTHTYTLSETDTSLEDMTYDTTVYRIEILISQGADGKLNALVEVNDSVTERINAEFVNTYNASLPVVPPTGDTGGLTIWIIIMIVSGITLVSLVVYEKHRKI